MSLGTVLVQPQRIRRATGENTDAALVDDVLSLATRLMVDSAQGGHLLAVFQEAIEAVSDRMEQRTAGGMAIAVQKLQTWLDPLIGRVRSLNPPANSTVGLDFIQQQLSQFATLVQTLTLDRLREHMTLILDILQNDLGITNSFLEDQVWVFVDDLIEQFDQIPADLTQPEQENRRLAASVLRRLKRRMQAEFVLPSLNAEQMAKRLLDLLRNAKLDDVIRKVVCVSSGASAALAEGNTLLQLVPFTAIASGNIAQLQRRSPATQRTDSSRAVLPRTVPSLAAPPRRDTPSRDLKYAWYASWLLGSKDRSLSTGATGFFEGLGTTILRVLPLPWMPNPYDDVWIDKSTGKLMRASLFGGGEAEFKDAETKAPYPGSFSDWTDLPLFNGTFKAAAQRPYYTFQPISQAAIENWSYRSAWIADALKMTLNFTSIEEGDWAANVSNAGRYMGYGIFELAARKPFLWWLPVEALPNTRTLWWILTRTPLATGLSSLQGIHTKASFGNALSFWFTLVVADGGEQYILNAVVDSLRNAFLSTLTLINNEGPFSAPSGPDTRPENLRESGGVVDLFGALLGLVLPGPPREDYGYPFQSANVFLLWNLLINGLAYTALKTVTGTAVAATLARAIDWGVFGKKLGSSAVASILSFYPALYLSAEGDTDEGKYNPLPNGAAYLGYPPVASSPYKLPYPEGVSYQCAQGNQGMWSHNNLTSTNQIYAYDFEMDQADVILASRPGTVVSFFDNTTDDTVAGGDWNNIVIRHDLQEDAAGNLTPLTAPLDQQDVGPGGTQTVTFAVYGHGRQNSITQLFAARGIPAASIVGAQVRRGQPIMRAGDTGNSFYNHLHIHVVGESLPRPAGKKAAPLSNAAKGDVAIPFVFQEVTGKLEINRFTSGIDGVPASLNYYTSANRQVP